MPQPEQETLRERLGRYPRDRYPVQHATTQFHLGAALLSAGDPAPARAALTVAADVFARAGMELEAGKATVMLGVALRTAGLPDEARAAFAAAERVLAAVGAGAEQAAAAYNRGLVCADLGDATAAQAAWQVARELFLTAGHPAQAAAAARDAGGSLLASGDVVAAVPLLVEAAELAQRAGDVPGQGASENALGLAQLAADDAAAAVRTLRSAVACFPRAVRPADHAMVKANLALAHEQVGEPARARLAARQALGVAAAAAPVREQAQQVLSRLPGPAHEALLAVLDEEAPEQRGPVLREEVLRLAEAPPADRVREARGLLDGLLARPGTCYELGESLLGVLLELPPSSYTTWVAALVRATASRPEQDAERLRAVLGSAMARFPLPQWQRLAASLNAEASAVGEPAEWR